MLGTRVGWGAGNRPQAGSWGRLSPRRAGCRKGTRKGEVDSVERTRCAEAACPSLQQGTHLGVEGLGLARLRLVV